MRRSAALMPLSEDHHHALLIASLLTRSGAATAQSSASLFADFIAEHESQHFALEESVLLPALPAGANGQRLADRVRADHRYLRNAALELRKLHERPSVKTLARVGARLRTHVQLEERELFPYLETSLDPVLLEQIGAQLREQLASADSTADSPEGDRHARPRLPQPDTRARITAQGGRA